MLARNRSFHALLLLAVTFTSPRPLAADSVPVLRSQGTFHGFLVLQTLDGKSLATGDLIQIGDGDHVTSRLTFHFLDGSLDDETTVFTQHKVFQLVTDHHIQRGPSFPQPLDMLVEAATGVITFHDQHGRINQDHLDLAPDVCNGLPLVRLLNLDPTGPPTRLSVVAPTPKPRLVHIVVTPVSEEPLMIGGVHHKATNFRIKVELGGIMGIVAPLIGKKPSDFHVWILGGEAPAFVREEGQFYEGGPLWRIDLVSPVFPDTR